jgi:hypothetical protein
MEVLLYSYLTSIATIGRPSTLQPIKRARKIMLKSTRKKGRGNKIWTAYRTSSMPITCQIHPRALSEGGEAAGIFGPQLSKKISPLNNQQNRIGSWLTERGRPPDNQWRQLMNEIWGDLY